MKVDVQEDLLTSVAKQTRSAKKLRGKDGAAAPATTKETEVGFKIAIGKHTFKPVEGGGVAPHSPTKRRGTNKRTQVNSPLKHDGRGSPHDQKLDYSVLMGEADDEEEDEAEALKNLFPPSATAGPMTTGETEDDYELENYFEHGGGYDQEVAAEKAAARKKKQKAKRDLKKQLKKEEEDEQIQLGEGEKWGGDDTSWGAEEGIYGDENGQEERHREDFEPAAEEEKEEKEDDADWDGLVEDASESENEQSQAKEEEGLESENEQSQAKEEEVLGSFQADERQKEHLARLRRAANKVGAGAPASQTSQGQGGAQGSSGALGGRFQFGSGDYAGLKSPPEPGVQAHLASQQPSASRPPAVTPAASSAPTTATSNLRPSSYARAADGPAVADPVPDPDDLPTLGVDEEPGEPGRPWYWGINFDKVSGKPVKDNLHSKWGYAVAVITTLAPRTKFLCQRAGLALPPVTSSDEDGNFPDTGAGVLNYVHVGNTFSLRPNNNPNSNNNKGKKKKKGRHNFDDNAEFDGPDRIYGVLLVDTPANSMELCNMVAMELEGSGVMVNFKRVQRKVTATTVAIPGLPLGLCESGLNMQLDYHLKQCEKELITMGKVDHNLIDVPLPPHQWRYNFSRGIRFETEALKQKYSLNGIKAFRENGCKWVVCEQDPSDMGRMGALYHYMMASGRLEKVCGPQSKIIMIPKSPDGDEKIRIQRFCKHAVVAPSFMEVIAHKDVEEVNKRVEVVMANGSAPRSKFTTLVEEYHSLQTAEGAPVVHMIMPRTAGYNAGSIDVAVDIRNEEALRIARNIRVCPPAWWWHAWELKGYSLATRQSLMTSFELDAARLANQSTFDVSTWQVHSHFANDDGFLDKWEAEYQLSDLEDDEVGHGGVDIPEDARERLASTLREDDDDIDLDRDPDEALRRPNFEGSVGNLSHRSITTKNLGADYKETKLEAAREKVRAATAEKKLEEAEKQQRAMQKEMQRMQLQMAAYERARSQGSAQPSVNEFSQNVDADESAHGEDL